MRPKTKTDCIATLVSAGISEVDARALRRISMTLHRWHELECGTDSYCVVRGRQDGHDFTYDDGAPYLEFAGASGRARYSRIADRERGALKRLTEIIGRYPGFSSYVQGDPRGAALFIMRPGDVPAGADLTSCYSRGIAVFK